MSSPERNSTWHLCVHGHFYQPPREDPFTGQVPAEPGAGPYHDFNEKIAAECYRPNARLGNFERLSFDLGPTLAWWLERHDPETYQAIVAADRRNVARFGQGNALAQAYNHTILPLATYQEKRIQVAWGVADFRHRFGRRPEGMWLAETAVDGETLGVLADFGLRFTILAPWQAQTHDLDTSEPYRVPLPDGRSIAVFFYHAPLSGGVSFDPGLTSNADVFVGADLPRHLRPEKMARGEPQCLMIATDGELYGHHQVFRDHFLAHLLQISAPAAGFEVLWPARYLERFGVRREVHLWDASSWSCHHGVERWRGGCACTEGNGSWKWHLRHALNRLASKIDCLYELEAKDLLRDPWPAAEDYLGLRLGDVSLGQFLAAHAARRLSHSLVQKLSLLLEAQYYRQLMFTSCAFFFEDLDRLEPAKVIAYGARAALLVREATGLALDESFVLDLRAARSWRTGRTGADLYAQVVAHGIARRHGTLPAA
ncbi:MAG: DUF3536 domain-containing protein [Chloroflexi bacterium]|nr:DUF3536 domain-containing protein [Chloroflexota bacterium]